MGGSGPAQVVIDVLFMLLPGSLILDWAGPAEALRIANRQLEAADQPARFNMRFVSPQPQVASSVGVALTTTHHQHLDELAQTEPRCDVVANRVFVHGGAVFSSAGVTTGIDLFLHAGLA